MKITITVETQKTTPPAPTNNAQSVRPSNTWLTSKLAPKVEPTLPTPPDFAGYL